MRLRLPSSVPFLLEGHKVGAGLAISGAVVAEFGAGSGGVRAALTPNPRTTQPPAAPLAAPPCSCSGAITPPIPTTGAGAM